MIDPRVITDANHRTLMANQRLIIIAERGKWSKDELKDIISEITLSCETITKEVSRSAVHQR
jgi:hypothetical protein